MKKETGSARGRERDKSPLPDAIIVVAIATAAFFMGSFLNLYQGFHNLVHAYEGWHIGALVIAFAAITIVLAILFFYRWRQLKRESKGHMRAERALRESEDRFSKIFNDSPVSITMNTLKDGTFLYVNDSFTRMAGYTREEVGGTRSSDEISVLTLLGQGAELSEVLDALLRLGEYNDPSIKGSVMLFDPAKQCLFYASGPSLPDEYNEPLKAGLPLASNVGSCGTAAYLKERVVIPDIHNSPF